MWDVRRERGVELLKERLIGWGGKYMDSRSVLTKSGGLKSLA